MKSYFGKIFQLFGEIAIHKKTGQIKIVWSNLNRGCNLK
jgi:hypothetical protein